MLQHGVVEHLVFNPKLWILRRSRTPLRAVHHGVAHGCVRPQIDPSLWCVLEVRREKRRGKGGDTSSSSALSWSASEVTRTALLIDSKRLQVVVQRIQPKKRCAPYHMWGEGRKLWFWPRWVTDCAGVGDLPGLTRRHSPFRHHT